MPSDTYILTISEAGVSVPSTHGSTHISGGSDPIPVATASTSGLMSAAIFTQHGINTDKVSNATHTGDVTDAAGVLTVSKINGVALAPLGTGILRMSSGTPSLATDGTQFPTLNQSTTGNAATATTATNVAGGSAGTIPYQTAVNTTAQTSVGTSGQILKSNGTSAPTWTSVVDVIPTLNQSTTGNAATATLAATATTATTATNIAGGAVGAVPYQTGSGATALLSAGTAGYVLKSNGSAAPSWAAVDLSTETSGTLPVASGGTGATTLTAGLVKASGTSAFTTVTAPSGDIVGTTDTQTLTNKTLGSGTTFSSAVGVASGGTGAATFTNGILKASGTTAFTTVTAPSGNLVGTTDTQTLTNKTLGSGTTLSGTIIDLTSNVTNTLPVSNGGTGMAALTGYVKGTGTTAMTASATVPVGDITGTLPVANGGTGVTNSTGTGANALATSPTLVTPLLGTPTSGVLSNCTGLSLTTGVTGTLPVTKGGTGKTSFDSTGPLYYDMSTNTIDVGVDGVIPIELGGTGATSLPAGFVQSNGTVLSTSALPIPITNGGTGSSLLGAGYIKSNGSALISGSLPIPVADGGTGRSTNATTSALIASGTTSTGAHQLLPNGTSGQFLRSNGTSLPFWETLSASHVTTGTLQVAYGGTGVTTLTNNGAMYVSGSGGVLTGTLPVASGGTGITSLTNNGAMYVGSSGGVFSGTLPIASGGTGQSTYADGHTVITSNQTVSVSGVNTFTFINVTGSLQSGTNMTNGTTNTFSLRNSLTATRNFNVRAIVELAVAPITITGVSYASNVVTVTVSGGHGIPSTATNMPAIVTGITYTGTNSNGEVCITYTGSTTFTFPVVGVTAVALGVTPQFVYQHSIGIRLASGSSGSLSTIATTESRGLFYPSVILSDYGANIVTETLSLSLSAAQEVAIYVANHTSTNSIIVRRARLIAETIQ